MRTVGLTLHDTHHMGLSSCFVHDLTAQAPPLARIVGVEVTDAPPTGFSQFEIRHSVAAKGRYQLISPDIAVCADCLRELLDPTDRRYRYPFTNCTNCGPRFTIIRDIPYDRPLTTMQPFAMCADCQREYDDPLDRRFHAQPNACQVCGPQVWLEEANGSAGRLAEGDEAMHLAGQMLLAGKVLGIIPNDLTLPLQDWVEENYPCAVDTTSGATPITLETISIAGEIGLMCPYNMLGEPNPVIYFEHAGNVFNVTGNTAGRRPGITEADFQSVIDGFTFAP